MSNTDPATRQRQVAGFIISALQAAGQVPVTLDVDSGAGYIALEQQWKAFIGGNIGSGGVDRAAFLLAQTIANSAVQEQFTSFTPFALTNVNFPVASIATARFEGTLSNLSAGNVTYEFGVRVGGNDFSCGAVSVLSGIGPIGWETVIRFARTGAAIVQLLSARQIIATLSPSIQSPGIGVPFAANDTFQPWVTMDTADPAASATLNNVALTLDGVDSVQ